MIFLDIEEELAEIDESEIEEEVESSEESQSEESKCETEEESKEEWNEMKYVMCRMCDGWCCIFALTKCVESKFLCEFNMRGQRKYVLEWSEQMQCMKITQ